MVEFARPEWLWGLAALPLVAFLLAIDARRRRAALTGWVGTHLGPALSPGFSWRRLLAKGVLRLLALASILVALAGPRFGSQLVKVEREGIDAVVALDVSLSMMAEDVLPSRLERAKQEIADLIGGLRGDRVGIVVFAGDAVVLCPLTVDYDAALMLARSADVYTVSEQGSDIAEAIEVGTAMFEGSQGGDRALILITDGESQEGDPEGAARAAAEKGIRIYPIGLGSTKGELIPERGTDGSVKGYKKDSRGETVLSRLDEATLQRVASASGGKYLPATTEGLEIKVLYDEISGMEKKLIKGEFVERRKERFWIALAAALACLLGDALLGTRATLRGDARARSLHTGVTAMLAMAAALALAGVDAAHAAKSVDRGKVRTGNTLYKEGEYARAFDAYRQALGDTTRAPKDAPGAFYNGGNALYMQNEYDRALDYYQRGYSPDSTLTGRMLYNRGNALLKGGRVGEAIESYVQALQYLPDDEDARHNLEMALAAKQQQQQQQKQEPQPGQGQNDSEEQQQGDGQSSPDSTQSDSDAQEQQQSDSENQDQPEPPTPPDSTSAQPDSSQQDAHPDSSSTPLTAEQMQQLSPEDAMRILQALENREQELQKERRKAAFRKLKRSGKDW